MVRNASYTGTRCLVPYRPLVEQLEDRLPPGDAVFAGLFARGILPERAAGLVPADGRAVLPGQARRLAEPSTFALLPQLTDAEADFAPPPRQHMPAVVVAHRSDEPFVHPVAAVRPTAAASSLAEPLPSGVRLDLAAPVGHAGTAGGTFFAAPAMANYQLDQAVAALVPPTAGQTDSVRDEGSRNAGVYARFNLGHPSTGPFPSNWFTVGDDSHLTGQRVNLPYPDCQVYVSDCEDIAVLNELDGFNLQPRLSLPFTGPIDVNSVNYTNVFLVSLGSTTDDDRLMPRGYGVAINQVVWDVATNTLHVESDELLAQHTRFGLYVTTGLRDAQGDPVQASPTLSRFLHRGQGEYHDWLLDAMVMAQAYGFEESDIAVASVFTTQSATAVLEKIRDQIKAETPEPADFLLGPKGERTMFNLRDVTGITWRQQIRVGPPPVFNPVNLDLPLLRDIFPDAVGQLAFGKYLSPDYEVHPDLYIPAVGTRTGTPVVQGTNEIYFNLVLPSGPKPVGGWPVTIFGHGGGDNKNVAMTRVAASMAHQGVATIIINAVGHAFGPLGTLTVDQTEGQSVTLPAGGRATDQNGDGVFGPQEGFGPALRPRVLITARDGIRQTAIDLMQLVRVTEVGMDVDGDGSSELNPRRVYYFGFSHGGNYGVPFLAVEPGVRAGVVINPGHAYIGDAARLAGRAAPGNFLAARLPSRINSPGVIAMEGVAVNGPHYHDNLPLRNGIPLRVRLADNTEEVIQAPVINTVAGAMAIQDYFDHNQWAVQAGNPVAYAPHLRKAPLAAVPAKSVIVQFGKADQSAANPNVTAVIRAGDLADRATFYRHDLAYAEDPRLPRDSHPFVVSTHILAFRQIALGAQGQIATFFASDGKTIIHPEPARYFEVPIKGPLPEDLNFIPDP